MDKFKKTITLLLCCVFAFSLAACNEEGDGMAQKLVEGKYTVTEKGTPVEFHKLTFDFIGGEDVMPVGGYWGPYQSGGTVNGQILPDLLSEQIYEALADAGINMIVRSADNATVRDYAAVEYGLGLAEKYGIGVFTPVSDLEQIAGQRSTYKAGDPLPFSLNDYQNMIQKFSNYNSFLGVSVTDEPLWNSMDGLKRAFGLFEEIGFGNEYVSYCNVLGSENASFGDSSVDADMYFDKLFGDIKIPYFSATGYYYTQKDTPDAQLATLFNALSSMRSSANAYGIPLWRMLQAGGNWNDSLNDKPSVPVYPNEGELLFDVNIALAYGCKAIQYFPLVQPSHFAYASGGTYDFHRNGLIGAAGNKTEWYYYAQKANKQIAAIDHVLMNAANMGLIAHGDKAVALSHSYDSTRTEFLGDSFRQLTSVTGDDCYVGCFDYKGGTALYVGNYDRNNKSNVTLNFADNYGYEVIQRAKTAEVMGKSLNLTLECGEGVLVVLK